MYANHIVRSLKAEYEESAPTKASRIARKWERGCAHNAVSASFPSGAYQASNPISLARPDCRGRSTWNSLVRIRGALPRRIVQPGANRKRARRIEMLRQYLRSGHIGDNRFKRGALVRIQGRAMSAIAIRRLCRLSLRITDCKY